MFSGRSWNASGLRICGLKIPNSIAFSTATFGNPFSFTNSLTIRVVELPNPSLFFFILTSLIPCKGAIVTPSVIIAAPLREILKINGKERSALILAEDIALGKYSLPNASLEYKLIVKKL